MPCYVIDDVSMTSYNLAPNVVTLKNLLQLRPNVITFWTYLHLG